MRMKPPGKALFLSLAVSVCLGSAFVLLAGSKPLLSFERRIYDFYLRLSAKSPPPRDFLVLDPDVKIAAGNPSAHEALQLFRLLDEMEVGRVALAGKVFEGGPDQEELAALRSELPKLIDRECGNIKENIRALFGAILAGSVPSKALNHYVDNLAGIVDSSGERIKEASDKGRSPTLGDLKVEGERIHLAGGGFSETMPDPDGTTRRIALVSREGGHLLPRVELAALMDELGDPGLSLEPGRVLLTGARFPGVRARSLTIPVDGEGRALLRWPRPGAANSPRRLDLATLLEAISEEESFLSLLGTMETGALLTGDGATLTSRYRHAEQLHDDMGSGYASAEADWRDARRDFFSSALDYFRAKPEAQLISSIEAEKARFDRSNEILGQLESQIEKVKLSYSAAEQAIEKLTARRAALSESLRGSFVFLSLAREKAPLITSFGREESSAFAGAVFAASVVSESTYYSRYRHIDEQ